MTVIERQMEIMKNLKSIKITTVKKLAQQLFVSEASVRRDIKALEVRGLLKQVYGGVMLPEYEHSVMPAELRESTNTEIKDILAKRAAEYLFDGATVILDGSSTVRRITKYMEGFSSLKVITNNQRILNELKNPEISIYSTGGLFNQKSNVLTGSSAERFIGEINADLLFFSSQAVSDDGEISDASEEETALRRIMLKRSEKKIFLCDSTKIGIKRSFTLCTKDDVDVIICDKPLPW